MLGIRRVRHWLFGAPHNTRAAPSPAFDRVWQNVSLSKRDYNDVYVATIRQHHALDPGGFGERIDFAVLALGVRKAFFLPPGTPPERLHLEDDMWTFAVFICALLDGSAVEDDPWASVSPIASRWLNDTARAAIDARLSGKPSALDGVFTAIDERVVARAETEIKAWCRAHVSEHYSSESAAFINGDDVLILDTQRQTLADEIQSKGMILSGRTALTAAFLAPAKRYSLAGLDPLPGVPVSRHLLATGHARGAVHAFEDVAVDDVVTRSVGAQPTSDVEDEQAAITRVMAVLRDIAAQPTVHALDGPAQSLIATKTGVFVSGELWRHLMSALFSQDDVAIDAVWTRNAGNRYLERRITDQSYPQIGNTTGVPTVHVRDDFYRTELGASVRAVIFRHVDHLQSKELRARLVKYLKSVELGEIRSGRFPVDGGALALTVNKGVLQCARSHLMSVGTKRETTDRLVEALDGAAEICKVTAPNGNREAALVIDVEQLVG